MNRTTLISASLLLAFAGCTCGQGWRPNILTRMYNRVHGVSNVGAPCDAGCEAGMTRGVVETPMSSGGCDTCNANSSNYGGYNEQIIGSYEGTPVGSFESVPAGNYSSAPMTSGAPIYNSPSYPMNTAPQSARMNAERIVPKPAN